ncbi:MAG: nucleotidyltransferase family protein [Candidatus Lambdaproteobacteria bacterium]|nr:nucleotidyltransferase family protein [Candidatus Lambdaproteobacteria bacterium]
MPPAAEPPADTGRRAAAQPVLILAAGHGTRLGGPKAFIAVGGPTFAERILARCAEAGAPVTLVLDPRHGARWAALLARWQGPAPRRFEADGTRPMVESVRVALAAGDFGQGVWVWPVDAPFLSAAGWRAARAAVAGAPLAIWKLRAEGRSGHPLWLPGWACTAVGERDWPDGLRGLLTAHLDSVRVLELPGERLYDVDTPEALAALQEEG